MRPSAHFMAFAPLDVWWRLLKQSDRINPRYWPRLAACLATSILGTAITLPERLLRHSALRRQYQTQNTANTHATVKHDPGAVFVLGHYRTGTTHLHYLLSCDDRMYTPRWHQCLAPHGHLLSWTFLRLFLVPFMSEQRPQDDVSLGPDWPAEDEFAVNNLALASALPGRFVIPGAYSHYTRFHDLAGLADHEYERWRHAQWAFLTTLSRRAASRALLLKSPSHTAHVRDIVQLFPPDQPPRFVHIARNAEDVIHSNFNMAKRLIACYGLQAPPDDSVLLNRVIDEYARSQRAFARDRDLIPEGQLACIHFDDLCADALGTLRFVYEQLSLDWSDALEARAQTYLQSVAGYRPSTRRDRDDDNEPSADKPLLSPEQQTTLRELSADDAVPVSALLHCVQESQNGNGTDPGRTSISTPRSTPDTNRDRRVNPWAACSLTALIVAVLWIILAVLLNNRMDTLIWPAGLLIGWTALRTSRPRGGSWKLGLWAAALTLLLLPAIAHPVTKYTHYRNHPQATTKDIWTTAWHEMSAGATLFWLFMGTATAYRYGSRSRVPPNL
ncbi:MAG: sulfotransferase [Planctomycetes bacterium]|nr:sulfotransferase [Planctomycetota bacterium]